MDLSVKKSLKRKLSENLEDIEEGSDTKTVRLESCLIGENSLNSVEQTLSSPDGITADQCETVDNQQSEFNATVSSQSQQTSVVVKTETCSDHEVTLKSNDGGPSEDVDSSNCDLDTLGKRADAANQPKPNVVAGQSSKAASAGATGTCSDNITDEEKDRFAFISQQLDILNTQPVEVPDKRKERCASSSAKSGKVVWRKGWKIKIALQEKHRRAVVKKAINSPRKCKKPRGVECSPSPPEVKSEFSDEGDLTPSSTSESGEISESGDTDEEGLAIDEHKETDLDEQLEREALKNNLTAINVKSILHHVVTDKNVLDMVQNSLSDINSDQKEAAFEPKQTRSKTKVGNALFPWVLSPVKKPAEPKPSFMEMLFSDEEDEDEEYQPEKDLEAEDTDTESLVSSRMSDFGSPCPTTPSTPAVGPQSKTKETSADSEVFQSPVNPPSVSGRPSSARQLGRKFQDAMDKANDEDGPETVAHRTRSKVPLTNTSLAELESSFVAPDITPDMYQTELENPDWANFLTGLQAPRRESEDTRDTADDDNSDPEYNFLAEVEEEEPDTEDFRNDKATKITKKEVNELLDELLSEYAEVEEEDSPVLPGKSKKSVVETSSSSEMKTDSSDQEEVTPAGTAWSSESGELTESDGTGLEIAEDVETDLDKRLETDAERNNLTATNVKNLLHHIITNEHVLDMVQNSLMTEVDSSVKEAAYEPKMTRSKTKVGTAQALFPWVLSPVKKPAEPKPSFMEMLFSEEEDEDEEYQPEKDLEATDTDTESVVSSRMSDFGSPCPTTPSTPGFGSAPKKSDSELSKKNSEIFQSPLNRPPISGKLSAARQLGRKFQDAMEKANDDDPETVAHRTRSKVPLTNTSLFELESSFVAPDITTDMYQTDLEDPDWANFLTGLQAPPIPESEDTRDTADDDNSDPEYNFLAEVEEEEPDKEDFRNDKATKITKKELNELLDELVIAYGDGEDKEKKSQSKTPHPAALPRLQQTVPTPDTCKIKLTQQQLDQLNDQMKKHVQLLTQVFLLSHEMKSHHGYAKRCRVFLNELKQFGSYMPLGVRSAFQPNNLQPALDVISGPLPKIRNPQQPFKLRSAKPVCAELTSEVMDLMWTNRTFCFPQLLPVSNFLPHHIVSQQKVVFTPAEDRIIAMGLEDFRSFGESRNEMISKHLLPCKSNKQIKCRIKNQVAKKEDNPIKFYWKNKKLPVFPKSTEIYGCESDYPAWFQARENAQKQSVLVRCRGHSVSKTSDVQSEFRKSAKKKYKRKSSSGVKSAPVSPVISPMTSDKFIKTLPLSDSVKKLLDFGPGDIRPAKPSPMKSAIPVRLVHLGDNKAVISPIPLPQLTGDQKMPAPDRSPKVSKPGIAEIPLLSTASGHSRVETLVSQVSGVRSTTPVIRTRDITCVAPSILINQVVTTAVPSALTTTTSVTGGLITFTGINNRISISEMAARSPSSEESNQFISPTAPQLSQSAPNLVTRTKSAGEIMAAVAPFLSSPKTTSSSPLQPGQKTPTKGKSPCQKIQERTPPRGEQIHLPRLVPSPHTSPSKCLLLPYVPKCLRRNSPRRQQLKQQAKAILPKGFIVKSDPISPVKKAAYKVKSKARKVGRQRTLLPKLAPSPTVARPLDGQQTPPTQNKCEEEVETVDTDLTSECETQESDGEPGDDTELLDKEDKDNKKSSVSSSTQRDSADSQSEGEGTNAPPYDSQTEEEEGGADGGDTHLQELMEASTTIRHPAFPPKKPGFKDRRSKAQKHKDITLAMLDPDLIQADPMRDDRDIAFAQAYLDSVKTALKDDQELYGQFLHSLNEFGKKQGSPVELYENVKVILKDYPELVEDFSGFLLPEQAVKCGCYMANQQYHKVRSFLRKLETHFEKHPSHFQKIIKTFCQWKPGENHREIQTMLQPLLKGQQHLLAEFSLFFENERPPESHMTDFEEIDMSDSDIEEGRYLDGYEEIELLDEVDNYGTKRCECKCHDTKTDAKFFKRKKHCISCGLKIIGGKLYFRTTGNNLIPAIAVYQKSFWMDEQRQAAEVNSCTVEKKFSPAALTSVENIVENGLQNKVRDKIQAERAPVRKRIKPITLRAVPQGGRFIALDEVDETQDRTPIPWMTVFRPEKGSPFRQSGKRTLTIGGTSLKPLQNDAHTQAWSKSKCDINVKAMEVTCTAAQTVNKSETGTMTSDVQVITPVTVNSTSTCDILTTNSTVTSFSSCFFPSPCKDSNSSSMQDILAKAMKVAHVTNSDAELSMDQTSVSRLLEKPSATTSSSVEGEITFGSVSFADLKECVSSRTGSPEELQDDIWTKEADRLILESCASSGPTDTTFQRLAEQISNKSETQIRERFSVLMSLFIKIQEEDSENKGEG